jgi:virulence factor Mce-like protein
VVALISVALAGASGSCASPTKEQRAQFCAIMPDSVGLYVDNPVTQMGLQIGKVTAIAPAMRDVRVDFTVTNGRPLPQDVRAVIRSTSILADRALELVGNYESGPKLAAGGCVPLNRSSTPKSLSEVVGSSTTFINSINPSGSNNIGGVVSEADRAIRGQGPRINELLTKASSLLDSTDQAIGDIGSIVDNTAMLTSTLSEIRGTVKQILYDADASLPDAATGLWGAVKLFSGIIPIIALASDLESQLGGELQQTLDVVSASIRKLTPRAPLYARLLDPGPRYITGLANIFNNHQFSIRYRPPLYRVRTPDGVAACNIMNASAPGSCANVGGTPYAVDVALLQYVLAQANR